MAEVTENLHKKNYKQKRINMRIQNVYLKWCTPWWFKEGLEKACCPLIDLKRSSMKVKV